MVSACSIQLCTPGWRRALPSLLYFSFYIWWYPYTQTLEAQYGGERPYSVGVNRGLCLARSLQECAVNHAAVLQFENPNYPSLKKDNPGCGRGTRIMRDNQNVIHLFFSCFSSSEVFPDYFCSWAWRDSVTRKVLRLCPWKTALSLNIELVFHFPMSYFIMVCQLSLAFILYCR